MLPLRDPDKRFSCSLAGEVLHFDPQLWVPNFVTEPLRTVNFEAVSQIGSVRRVQVLGNEVSVGKGVAAIATRHGISGSE
jgi:hypothetical protein